MSRAGMERVSFDVPLEVNRRLNHHLQWGMKAQILRAVLEKLADDLDEHGSPFLTQFLERNKSANKST